MPKDTSKGSTKKKKSAAGKKACTICGDDISPQGFAAHLKKCKREKDEQETLLEYEKDVYGRALALLRGTVCGSLRSALLPMFTPFSKLKSDSTPPDHEDDITPGPELELDAQPEISGTKSAKLTNPRSLYPQPPTPRTSQRLCPIATDLLRSVALMIPATPTKPVLNLGCLSSPRTRTFWSQKSSWKVL